MAQIKKEQYAQGPKPISIPLIFPTSNNELNSFQVFSFIPYKRAPFPKAMALALLHLIRRFKALIYEQRKTKISTSRLITK